MTYTKHGHHIGGTPKSDKGDIVTIACGGLGSCTACIQESAHVYYDQIQNTKLFLQELPVETDMNLTTEHESSVQWPLVAVDVVQEWATESLGVPRETSFYIVWFAFILGEWKALVSSTAADGRYYEVTYNQSQKETYVDTYKKTHNICILDKE